MISYVWMCTKRGFKNSIFSYDFYELEEDFRNFNK